MPRNVRSSIEEVDRILEPLAQIARNVWWSWNPDAVRLFEYADPRRFAATGHNPVLTIAGLSAKRKRELVRDEAFVAWLRCIQTELRRYLRAKTWFDARRANKPKGSVAYFCMEYALHESLPLYAGGLGVLAGDHLKSCSDLGIPLVGVGIYWRNGYTRQRIDADGRQQDEYRTLLPRHAPVSEVTTRAGQPLRVKTAIGSQIVAARVWRLDVGRVPLFLLDADLPENAPRDRKLTHVLYSGDRDTRIRQEILLGIGGWRALRAMRIPVTACHLNEGHAVFASIERIGERIRRTGETFGQAKRYVANTTVFTTHTPVPAGNETFDPDLVDRYMAPFVQALGITREAFHDLARIKPGHAGEPFGMTPLALRTSRGANAVAALHGKTARGMWKRLYPGKRVADVPIGHVTNGVHVKTWLHPLMAELYQKHLGPDWDADQDRGELWRRLEAIPDAELWTLRLRLKAELIAFCQERLAHRLRQGQPRGARPVDAAKILSPEALTIGFARRFAPYKRATLLFTDPARLAKLLNDRLRPVQIIFAGKAHPADEAGKALIREVVKYARSPRFRRRVVFLEDYDMEVGRRLVAGCDVWLNNPRRPQEASGTSGMKPPLHGGLNLSVLDGWWPEGYDGTNGWAIGTGKDHDGTDAGDRRDANALYRILERQIVPSFYARGADGIPKKWLAGVKSSMTTVPPVFNCHRQVKQYLTRYYLPALSRAE